MPKLHRWQKDICAAFAIAIVFALAYVTLMPDIAFADEETIYDSAPDILDIGKNITKWLYGIISSLASGLMGWASEFYDIISSGRFVGGDLSSFPQVENMVKQIINQVIVPISQGLLGFMLAFELLHMEHDIVGSVGNRGMALGGFEHFIFFMIKYSILYVVLNHIYVIMYGIFAIFNWISDSLQGLLQVSLAGSAINASMLDSSFRSLTYEQSGMLFMLLIIAFVVLVVVAWTAIYSQVLAISRIFEIFILIAFAGIPLTTFANKQLQSIGIEFIKTFCGACLQLGIIYAIVGIGGPLISGITGSITTLFTSTDTGIEVLMKACVPIVSCLALYVMLKQSRTLANKVFGIMF